MAAREGTTRISAPAVLGLLGSNGSPRLRTDLFVWLMSFLGPWLGDQERASGKVPVGQGFYLQRCWSEGKRLMAISVGSFPKLQKRKVGQKAYKGWNLEILGSVPTREQPESS